MSKYKFRYSLIFFFLFNLIILPQVPDININAIESIDPDQILDNITFLAGDSLKGRNTGTDENLLAAMFIADKFKRAGLVPFFELNSNRKNTDDIGLNIENSEYYAEYFQKYNIQSSRLSADQTFNLSIEDGVNKLEYGYKYREDFFVQFKGSVSLSLVSDLTFAGYGISNGVDGYNDYSSTDGKEIDVKNKVVVIVDSYPGEKDTGGKFNSNMENQFRLVKYKARDAVEKGAAAVVVVQSPFESIPFNEKYKRSFPSYEREYAHLEMQSMNNVPVIYVSEKVRDELFNLIQGAGLKEILSGIDSTLIPAPFNFYPMNAVININLEYEISLTQNVIGYIEGADPELRKEYLVIGAHYDHVGLGFYGAMDRDNRGQIHNGADDNASGTCGLIEIAEAFALAPPRRSIIFIAFNAEEKGLLGSRYYVYYQPLVPLEATVAMLNLDMIGRNEPEVLWIGGAFQGYDIIETVKKANTGIGFELLYNVGMLSSASDQAHFLRKEIPSVFFFSGLHDDYHMPSDDIDKINIDKIMRVSRLAYTTAWILGNQDSKPEFKELSMEERAILVKESSSRLQEIRKSNE